MLIRDLPPEDRPRGRLLENGSQALSDTELVSILLGSGRPRASAIDVAREVLRGCGGIAGLVGRSPEALRCRGIGEAKSATLVAAVELGRRMARATLPEREPLQAIEAVAEYLALRYARPGQEVVGAMYVDRKQRVVGECEHFRGTLSRAAVEPRPFLRECLLRNATGFLLFHTHPSGNPAPSLEDLTFTRHVAAACEVVGVRLLDHLIVGSPTHWVSLKRRSGL
jgi:DNA repair protein RadC